MPTEIAPHASAAATQPESRAAAGPRKQLWARHRSLAGPVGILAILVVVFTAINPRFVSLSNIQAVADNAAAPMVIAVGLTLVILMGSIDLSVEGVIATVSVAVSLLLANNVNANNLGAAGIIIALAVGVLFGLANGLIYTKLRLPSLIVTLGTWFVGLGIGSILFPDNPPAIADEGYRSLALKQFLGFQRLDFIALAVVVLAALTLRYTRFGRTLYAIGGAEDLVKLAGVKIDRYKIAAFTIAGLLFGIAGLLLTAQLGIGNVSAGSNQLFPGISAVVVGGTLLSGGRGGIAQTVLGVLILAALTNGMVLVGVSPYIQQAVIGAIIVAAVLTATWRARRPLRIIK